MEQFSFLGRLEPHTRQLFMGQLHPRHFEAGQIIHKQNDAEMGLFLLQSGSVFLYRQSGEKKQVLALMRAGDCFGGESVVNHKPSPYTARAVTATQVLWLAPEHLAVYIQDHPDFLSVFLALMAGRLQRLTALVHDLAFRDVSARLAVVLLLLAEAHGKAQDDGLLIPQMVSQNDLAEMVGTAREVIYRSFKQFEEAGILKKSRSEVLIYDLEALRKQAETEAK